MIVSKTRGGQDGAARHFWTVLMQQALLQKTFSVQVFCSCQLLHQLWLARQTLALRIAQVWFALIFVLHLFLFLSSENKPYLFSSDFIGAPLLPDMESNGFVAAGTCTEQVSVVQLQQHALFFSS